MPRGQRLAASHHVVHAGVARQPVAACHGVVLHAFEFDQIQAGFSHPAGQFSRADEARELVRALGAA